MDDHSRLPSELDSHDLSFALDPVDASDADVFEFDPDADSDETFPQSVASGGPTPTGVLLWTRVAPGVFDPDEPLGVQVARDERFEEVVYDGVASRTGRCRTLPRPDASPDSVSFAVLACQNYRNGYFPAYHYVAEEDVDFLIHLGDFIYESDDGHFTGLGSYDCPGREKSLPSGRDRVWNLADYRYLYRTYRSDEFLREVLETHTLIAGWDDHEIVNDVYWDPETDAPAGDHPRGDNPEFMTELVAEEESRAVGVSGLQFNQRTTSPFGCG